MAFFDTGGPDGFISTSDINRLERGWYSKREGRDHPSVLFMNDGKKIHVEHSQIDRLVEGSYAATPALEGFNLLTYWYDPSLEGDVPSVQSQPIIAWRLRPGSPMPVVLEECIDDETYDRTAIEQPDGQVYSQGIDKRWSSRMSWEGDMKRQVEGEYEALQFAANNSKAPI